MDNLEFDIKNAAAKLAKKQQHFDRTMSASREVIRSSAEAITLIHNGKLAEAKKVISSMSKNISSLKKADTYEYLAMQPLQEYTEALILFNIKAAGRIPDIRGVGVPAEAYMLGLMDVVGELKRELLDALRESRVEQAETYMELMERIYDTTRSIRFAEAVLKGFRKKQDVARIQIESASSELLRFKS